MKTSTKFLVTPVALALMQVSLANNDVNVPYGYKLIDSAIGVQLYSNSSNDVYVQVSDLKEVKFENVYGRKKDGNLFYRYHMAYHLRRYDFSVINGAFFNQNLDPTPISHPFIPGGYYWGNTEPTKTLCVNGIYARVRSNGKNHVSNSDCEYSVTLLSPDVSISKDSSIGRTYIGIPDTRNTSPYKSRYVIFIVAKSKTQNQINVLTTLFKEMNIDFEYTPPQEESYIPNDLTLQAMKEAETMAKEKNKKSYATVEELIESLKN